MFSLYKAKTEANLLKKNATYTTGNLSDKNKTKAVIEPLLYHQKPFHSNKLLGYNRHTWTVKDGEKGLRYQIKPYSETKPCQKEGGVKIMKSSISAQFKSCIGDIPNMRTIKGKKSLDLPCRRDYLLLITWLHLVV